MAGAPSADQVPPASPRPAQTQAGLAGVAGRLPGPVFAVLDGGHFDDLPAALAGVGLGARSLFLGDGGRDEQRFGPWLLAVQRPEDVAAVLALVGDLPAVVFWSCAEGEVALYGHLRKLNRARLPVWAAAGKDGPEPGVDADRGWEAVLFRHWDPSVLGALLPVLDEGQFSRILGPAGEVAFFAEDYGGAKRVVADPEWPIAPAGMLTIRPEQVEALTERRVEASRRRIAAYLRDVAGEGLAGASERDLHEHVLHSEATGKELGLMTEAGQCRWAYMMYATHGEAARKPEITEYIKSSSNTPDSQLELVMGESIRHLTRTQAQVRSGVGL